MAFVRKRGGSHQLIETYREGGTVRQRVLANLGPYPSVQAATRAEPQRFRHLLDPEDAPNPVVSSVVSGPVVVVPKPVPKPPPLNRIQLAKLPPEEAKRHEAAQARYRAAQAAIDAVKRREVIDALAPLTALAKLINSPKKIAGIDDAFAYDDDVRAQLFTVEKFVTKKGKEAERRRPTELTHAVRTVAAELPDLLGTLSMATPGKRLSRAARWQKGKSDAVAALQELVAVKEECADWRGNIPEPLADAQQATTDMLDTIEEVDLDSAIAVVEEIPDDVEFPRGFGRD